MKSCGIPGLRAPEMEWKRPSTGPRACTTPAANRGNLTPMPPRATRRVPTIAKRYLPWYAKLLAKIVLSRVPVSHAAWKRLGLFLQGPMDEPDYALAVFRVHYDEYRSRKGRPPRTVLEMGPGASLFSAVIGAAYGVPRTYLVDVGPFAVEDRGRYEALTELLRREGLSAPNVPAEWSTRELLRVCGAHYLTDGLASMRQLPDHSIDLIWSQAVLEHVRRESFTDTLFEMRRLLAPDGIASHTVDLEDHFSHGLNNLRFPEWLWEAPFMVNSGFYTNRIRYAEMLTLFREAAFDVETTRIQRWPDIPLTRTSLSSQFRGLSPEDLIVRGFGAVLTQGCSPNRNREE
ncbi:MAG: hypothetical protein NVS2B16_18960 [Chloroflexota bacterium]